jgi:hypothetical protein
MRISKALLRLVAGSALIASLALSAVAAGADAATGPWAQVGADAAHTGASTDTTFPLSALGAAVVQSQFQAPDSPAVAPAVADGWVYTPYSQAALGHGDIAVAPDAGGAGDAARYVTPGAIADQPVVDRAAERVWVIDSTGTLWGFRTRCADASCPAVAQAHVGTCAPGCTGSPVVGDGVVVAATSDGRVAAYRSTCTGTCAPLWTAYAGAGVTSTPALHDGLVLVATARGVRAFSLLLCGLLHGCAPVWMVPGGAASTVSVDTDDGIAFWTSADGTLVGSYGCLLALVTGTCPARSVTPLDAGPLHAPPIVDAADHLVIVALPDGRVEAFQIARCAGWTQCALRRAWTVTLPEPLGDTSPALADGVLWVGDRYGLLWTLPAAGCGSATCGYGHPGPPAAPYYQLDAGIDSMSLEVADASVWASQEADPCACGHTAELLTNLRRSDGG